MLLNDILKEKEELLEDFVLLEAEADLRKAVASALRSETKELTVAPKIDVLANKILDNYLNNLRQNKYENDRFVNDKRGFTNLSIKEFPSKNASRYLAIIEKNKAIVISAVEKAIKEKLSVPYTNDWIKDVFSDKLPKGYNKNVDVVSKRPETKKQEGNKGLTKKDFLIQVFDIFHRETSGKSRAIKKSWIQQHLTMELDQKPDNPPRPKCDDIVSMNGINGYEIEYKKVSKKLEKANDMFSMGASSAILYADIMKVDSFLSKVKEKESFEEFFILLKNTFKDEAVRLATSTIRGKKNYLIFATYMSGDKPYSSVAEGADFMITDRGSRNIDKANTVSRWELGISRKAKNLVDLPKDFWDNLDRASPTDKLSSYLEKKYDDNSQNRVRSGLGTENFLKKETSKRIVYDTLKKSSFKEGVVSKNPESKLRFIFKFENKPLFDGYMDFKFNKRLLAPTGDGSDNSKIIKHNFSDKEKKASSVDTDVNKISKELLSIKKGKKNV